MPIYCSFKFQRFCLCNFSFFKVSDCNCFYCNDFCYKVSVKHTLKKKGRVCRNIGKIYFPDREISLVLYITGSINNTLQFVTMVKENTTTTTTTTTTKKLILDRIFNAVCPQGIPRKKQFHRSITPIITQDTLRSERV